MNVATKVCRVCGKEYAACRSAKRDAGVFRWQEVACSPECGARYLQQITDSRNPGQKPRKEARRRVVETAPKDNVEMAVSGAAASGSNVLPDGIE